MLRIIQELDDAPLCAGSFGKVIQRLGVLNSWDKSQIYDRVLKASLGALAFSNNLGLLMNNTRIVVLLFVMLASLSALLSACHKTQQNSPTTEEGYGGTSGTGGHGGHGGGH
ncbi:hypothetical protein [Legionella sp. 227]|uniref:hypothetical protein n=1 Tax=Legionella sp. 227 TaxID=3367288 RepID=UPI00370D1525